MLLEDPECLGEELCLFLILSAKAAAFLSCHILLFSETKSQQHTCLPAPTPSPDTHKNHHFQLVLFLLCNWSQNLGVKTSRPISSFLEKEILSADSRTG